MKECTVIILTNTTTETCNIFVGRENYVSFFQTCMLVYYNLMNMLSYYHIWFHTLTKHSLRLHNVLLSSERFAKILQDFIIQ